MCQEPMPRWVVGVRLVRIRSGPEDPRNRTHAWNIGGMVAETTPFYRQQVRSTSRDSASNFVLEDAAHLKLKLRLVLSPRWRAQQSHFGFLIKTMLASGSNSELLYVPKHIFPFINPLAHRSLCTGNDSTRPTYKNGRLSSVSKNGHVYHAFQIRSAF